MLILYYNIKIYRNYSHNKIKENKIKSEDYNKKMIYK